MRFGLFICGMAVIFGSGAGPEAKGLYRLNADGTGLKLVVGVDKGASNLAAAIARWKTDCL